MVVKNAAAYDVGHHSLETVASANHGTPHIFCHEQQQAVVHVAFTQPPLFKKFCGKAVDIFRLYVVDNHHYGFCRCSAAYLTHESVDSGRCFGREYSVRIAHIL